MDQLYQESQRPGVAGAIADMTPRSLISRSVAVAAGIAFGVPAFAGTVEDTCRPAAAGDTINKFLGITVRERSLVAEGNNFPQFHSARIMNSHGCAWVSPPVAVAVSDPVYVDLAANRFTNAAGTDNLLIPGAKWDTATTGANGIAKLRLT